MALLTIGEARLDRIEELRIPNKISYFTDDLALIEANRHWLQPHFLDEHGQFDLVFQSWIAEVEGRVILIDPCTGNGLPHPVSFFNLLDTPFIERMEALGFRPQDIEFVVCTHLHHDHCGWNTHLRGGQWVPTFANARYIITRREYDCHAAASPHLSPQDLNIGVFERSVAPVMAAGLIDLVEGTHRLTPQVTVRPAPGHTLGHQLLSIEFAGSHVLFTGDCFHHPIQLVAPHVHFGDVENRAQLEATRRELVELSARHNAILIAAHTPSPHAVRAVRRGKTYHLSAWLPAQM